MMNSNNGTIAFTAGYTLLLNRHLLPIKQSGFFIVTIRAVLTSAFAAVASFEVIGFGKYDVAFL
jgi:hypothetical protein